MGEAIQGGPPNPVQGLGERQRRIQTAAQHQRVEEESDHPVRLGARTAGHRNAHRDVPLAAVPGEQGGVGGEQGHEWGRLVALAQRGEGLRRAGRYADGHEAAAGVAFGGPRPVGGEIEGSDPGELTAPVVQLRGEPLLVTPGPLPHRVVGVLRRGNGGAGLAAALHLGADGPEFTLQ